MRAAGFHMRILLAACVFIAGAVLIMGYMGLDLMQGYQEQRFQERNRFLARQLARNAELGILLGDQEMLQRLEDNLLREDDVIGVRVLDGKGQKLTAALQKEPEQEHYVSRAQVRAQSVPGSGTSDLLQEQGDSGQVIGRVEIYFSPESMQRMQKALRDRFALLALAVGLLAVGCFYLISKSLVNPVNRLAKVARQVARGNKEVRAEPDRIPETRELAVAFNSMLDSLEQSQQALEQLYQDMAKQKTMAELGRFAMLVAHEVKNPLGIIKSSLDILKAEPGVGKEHPMVEYMEDEIRRISQLLEDFLAFSRPSRPNMQQVGLNGLVAEYVGRFEHLYANHGLTVAAEISEPEVQADADPDLLQKALHNLLKNAAEANEDWGRILVRTRIQEGFWILEVQDQGPGIPQAEEENIFEPFWSSKAKGSGLGLAFVQHVAQVHQGRVEGRNLEQGGAVFRLEVPVDE